MIYFAQRAKDCAIKIGQTEDVPFRVYQVQCQQKCKVAILATMPGDVYGEAEIHHKFAALRVRGEWFRPEKELLKFIKDNAEPWAGGALLNRSKRYRHLALNVQPEVIEWLDALRFLPESPWLKTRPADHLRAALRDYAVKHGYCGEHLFPVWNNHRPKTKTSYPRKKT